jgi:DNA modification methylase
MAIPRNTILVGDALAELRKLPGGSIDCVVTSPPYYALRDYGVAGQLGLEPNVESWVANLRAVLTEVGRVLRPTGSLWLNLGDTFSRHARYGAASKSLLLAPERLLLALSTDGWLVRGKVIWAKSNPMPTSVRDRLAMTYEVVYHLTRSPRYFFDLDVIREPHRTSGREAANVASGQVVWRGPLAGKHDGLDRARPDGVPGHPLGKNPGDVWRMATRGHGDHHAAFPGELVRRPILATCPEAVCTACVQAWQRQRSRDTLGALVPCSCQALTRPGIVLDPFLGTGTVGVAARELGRDWLGIELSPAFAAIARARLGLEASGYQRPCPELAVAA